MGEFDLIARYFTRPPVPGSAVAVGVGDDCAVLQPAPGMQLAVSSDMLVQGRHFFADVDPRSLGHKALAVNLSDLAACGAEPLGFTLALLAMGTVREILGSGSLFGVRLFGESFAPWVIMVLPPGGFFVLGGWLLLFSIIKHRRQARQQQLEVQHVH